jgi:hypothetical protein
VITPVVDYALTRREIALARSSRSYSPRLPVARLLPQHRVAALIRRRIHDFHSLRWQPATFYRVMDRRRPRRRRGPGADCRQHARGGCATDVGLGAYSRRPDPQGRDYTLDGVAHQITAPTLIMDLDNDRFLKGQPQLVLKALTSADATPVTLTSAEGAGEHTHAALGQAHQVMSDWLDITLTR